MLRTGSKSIDYYVLGTRLNTQDERQGNKKE